MKIAAYNIENLFDRAKAFYENSSSSEKQVAPYTELTQLLALFQVKEPLVWEMIQIR